MVPSPVSVHRAMLGPTTSPGHLPAQEQPVGVLLHRGDTEGHKFPPPLVENQAGSQQTWEISPAAPLPPALPLSSPPAAGIRGQKPLPACSKLKSVSLITCPGGRSNEVRPGDEQAHLPAGAAGGVCARACVRAAGAASRIGCEPPCSRCEGPGWPSNSRSPMENKALQQGAWLLRKGDDGTSPPAPFPRGSGAGTGGCSPRAPGVRGAWGGLAGG